MSAYWLAVHTGTINQYSFPEIQTYQKYPKTFQNPVKRKFWVERRKSKVADLRTFFDFSGKVVGLTLCALCNEIRLKTLLYRNFQCFFVDMVFILNFGQISLETKRWAGVGDWRRRLSTHKFTSKMETFQVKRNAKLSKKGWEIGMSVVDGRLAFNDTTAF